MRAILLALALALVLGGCASTGYFPRGAFGPTPDEERLERQWLGSALAALHEPSLASARPSTHVVRVLVLPTWDHPRSFRLIIRGDGRGVLVLRRASGTGGWEPGYLDRGRRVLLSRRVVAEVLAVLEDVDFWVSGPSLGYPGGYDGTMVVVESTREGRYHVLADELHGDLRELVRLLRRAAGVRRW